jgi:hypothetical protein
MDWNDDIPVLTTTPSSFSSMCAWQVIVYGGGDAVDVVSYERITMMMMVVLCCYFSSSCCRYSDMDVHTAEDDCSGRAVLDSTKPDDTHTQTQYSFVAFFWLAEILIFFRCLYFFVRRFRAESFRPWLFLRIYPISCTIYTLFSLRRNLVEVNFVVPPLDSDVKIVNPSVECDTFRFQNLPNGSHFTK